VATKYGSLSKAKMNVKIINKLIQYRNDFIIGMIALFMSAIIMLFVYRQLYIPELLVGWLIALFYGCINVTTRRAAIKCDVTRFFIIGIGISGLEFILLLIACLMIIHSQILYTYQFLMSLFVSYFTYLIYIVINLNSYTPLTNE